MRIVFTASLLFTLGVVLILPTESLGDFTIATVDMSKVLNSSKSGVEKRSELEKRHEAMKAELAKNRALMQERADQLVKRNVPPTSQEAEFFRVQLTAFEQNARDRDAVIERDFLAINKELSLKAFAVIKQVATQRKIDLVVDKKDQGMSAVIYSTGTEDITDAVIEKINQQATFNTSE